MSVSGFASGKGWQTFFLGESSPLKPQTFLVQFLSEGKYGDNFGLSPSWQP